MRASTFELALHPEEIEDLKAGKRVTRTYPEPLPAGPPLLTSEDLESFRRGGSVTKLTPYMPPPFLQVGDVLPVISTVAVPQLPTFSAEDLQALMAGRTLTKAAVAAPPAPLALPELNAKVVDYKRLGSDHTYTFEAVDAGHFDSSQKHLSHE